MTAIYGLYDPREPDHIRYVGRANNAWDRFGRHIIAAARLASEHTGLGLPVHQWMRTLLREGIVPGLCVLVADTGARSAKAERVVIDRHVAEGHQLFNIVGMNNDWNTNRKAKISSGCKGTKKPLRRFRAPGGQVYDISMSRLAVDFKLSYQHIRELVEGRRQEVAGWTMVPPGEGVADVIKVRVIDPLTSYRKSEGQKRRAAKLQGA